MFHICPSTPGEPFGGNLADEKFQNQNPPSWDSPASLDMLSPQCLYAGLSEYGAMVKVMISISKAADDMVKAAIKEPPYNSKVGAQSMVIENLILKHLKGAAK